MKYEGAAGLADALIDAGIIDVPIEKYPEPEISTETDEPMDGMAAAPLNEPGRLSPAIPLFTPELHEIAPDYAKLVKLGKALYED